MHARCVAILGLLGLGLLLLAGAPAGAADQLRPGGSIRAPAATKALGAPALNAEQLTREQFARLPDTALIEVQGRQTTAGAIRARRRQQFEALQAKLRAQGGQGKAKFEAARNRFLQRQKADLATRNVRVHAEAARLSQAEAAKVAAHAAAHREATELLQRFQTAPPAERTQIQLRARELQRQLQQIPR